VFLTSALDGGELSASRPGRFKPRQGALAIHWIGDWVSLRAGVEQKHSCLCRESNSGRPTYRHSSLLFEVPRSILMDRVHI